MPASQPVPTAPEFIGLPRLASELTAAYGKPGPGYSWCYRAVADGKLPALIRNNRIYFRREDLPRVAEILGIIAPAA